MQTTNNDRRRQELQLTNNERTAATTKMTQHQRTITPPTSHTKTHGLNEMRMRNEMNLKNEKTHFSPVANEKHEKL